MKFASDFDSFLRLTVNLNQDRLDRLQSSVLALENFLAATDTFADGFIDVIPAGSWAHRTIIKPVGQNDEFDADILLYLQEAEDWQPVDYIANLLKVFQASSTYKGKVKAKTRCTAPGPRTSPSLR